MNIFAQKENGQPITLVASCVLRKVDGGWDVVITIPTATEQSALTLETAITRGQRTADAFAASWAAVKAVVNAAQEDAA